MKSIESSGKVKERYHHPFPTRLDLSVLRRSLRLTVDTKQKHQITSTLTWSSSVSVFRWCLVTFSFRSAIFPPKKIPHIPQLQIQNFIYTPSRKTTYSTCSSCWISVNLHWFARSLVPSQKMIQSGSFSSWSFILELWECSQCCQLYSPNQIKSSLTWQTINIQLFDTIQPEFTPLKVDMFRHT